MNPEFLLDLFADFGPVTIRRMFSGFGIFADGTHFALALRGAVYLRADEQTIGDFEAAGSRPLVYQTRAREVTVKSYWQLPERLYDDPQEFGIWARAALAAAHRAPIRPRARPKAANKPGPVSHKRAVRTKSAAGRPAGRSPRQSP